MRAPREATLLDVLRGHAEDDPARPWLTFERDDGVWRSWSYGEFLTEVEGTARAFGELGLRQGDAFVVYLDNHPELVRLVLAAAASGRVAVPADTRLTEHELADYFEVSGARVVFTRKEQEAADAAARATGADIVHVGDPLGPPAVSGTTLDAPGRADDVVELLFTSGTTSRPKGVMLTSRSLLHGAAALACGAGYGPADVPLVTLPLYHAAAQIHQLWPALLLGGRAVVVERFRAARFFAQAASHGATTSAQFSTTLRLLLRRGSSDDAGHGAMRHITFAQNLTPAEHAAWDARFGIPLQQLWGMTETSGLPLMSPLVGERRLEAMGRPVEPFYEVVLRDECGNPVSAGSPGEITVRLEPGVNGMLGYYRNEEATAAAVREGWLWTGDVARVDEDGLVHFLGRRGDIIRRGATSFSALEVEAVVRDVPGVLEVAVVGVADAFGEETVAVFVVRAADDRPTAEEIRVRCRAALASFKRPTRIEFLPQLPRTAVGKIQKHLLPVREEAVRP